MPKKSGLIDEKDRKILIELDKNSRQTDSAIGKKVGTTKQVVNYRIKKMVDSGVITNFYTVINPGEFGMDSYYLFLQLENINGENEKKILDKLTRLSYVGWLASGMGRWDAVMQILAESPSVFEKYLNEIVSICGKNLHEHLFTTLVASEHIGYKFLGSYGKIEEIKMSESNKSVTLNKIDKKILETISQNARLSLIEISSKTKIPLHIVNYHLKNLIKSTVIEGFKPKINVQRLGFQWHLLLVRFRAVDEKRKKEFISFCRNHKKVYYVTNTIGNYNLMIETHLSRVEEFKEFLLEIKDKFSDIIKVYESMIIFEEHKISYLPEI